MHLYLADVLSRAWADQDPFVAVEKLQGEVYRNLDGRTTLRFELEGCGYFVKIHRGIGVGEILKNLLRLRSPVLGADNEWLAIECLQSLGVDTMTAVGFGRRGWNPARRFSFIVTEALEPSSSLEEYCAEGRLERWGISERRLLVRKLANITRTLHSHGVNHRDYYLCHFLLDESEPCLELPPSQRPLYLIDLHRVQLRKRLPKRWRIKDLASLCYSMRQAGFTRRDELWFLVNYRGGRLSSACRSEIKQWKKIDARAQSLYQRGIKKGYHD